MKSLEAIRASKLGKKGLGITAHTGPIGDDIPTAELPEDRDFRGIKDGVKDAGPISAKSLGSLEVLKSHKLGAQPVPSASGLKIPKKPMYEAQVELGPTETKHSPIKEYLKKRGGR